jgi:hypothetical protein
LLEKELGAQPAASPLRARLLSRLAQAVWCEPPRSRTRTLARESVVLARCFDDADALAECLVRAHRICQHGPGDLEERLAYSRELAALVPHLRDTLVSLAAGGVHLWDAMTVGEPQPVHVETERMRREALRLQAPHAEWIARVAGAAQAHLTGRFTAAAGHAGRALAIGREAGIELAERTYAAQMLAIRRNEGRLDELAELLGGIAARGGSPLWALGCALALRAAGDAGPARALLGDLTADRCAQVPRDATHPVMLILLGDLAVDLGECDAGRATFEALQPLRALHGVTSIGWCHAGSVARTLGALATLDERFDEAEELLREGLARDRRLGAAPFLVRGLADRARLLERRGRPGDAERAERALAESRQLARRLGMRAA